MQKEGTTPEKQKKESIKNMLDYLFILVTLHFRGGRGRTARKARSLSSFLSASKEKKLSTG